MSEVKNITWQIEITHDEIIALAKAVVFYADAMLEKIPEINADELTTAYHLNTLAGKLPTLEEEEG